MILSSKGVNCTLDGKLIYFVEDGCQTISWSAAADVQNGTLIFVLITTLSHIPDGFELSDITKAIAESLGCNPAIISEQ